MVHLVATWSGPVNERWRVAGVSLDDAGLVRLVHDCWTGDDVAGVCVLTLDPEAGGPPGLTLNVRPGPGPQAWWEDRVMCVFRTWVDNQVNVPGLTGDVEVCLSVVK